MRIKLNSWKLNQEEIWQNKILTTLITQTGPLTEAGAEIHKWQPLSIRVALIQ